MTIKDLKKELRITDATIAQWFGYSNVQSYRNSSGKVKIEAGLLEMYYQMNTKFLRDAFNAWSGDKEETGETFEFRITGSEEIQVKQEKLSERASRLISRGVRRSRGET